MQEGAELERTIGLPSPEYFESPNTTREWQAALANQRLLTLRVRACTVPKLIADVVYVDFIGADETTARERLVRGVKGQLPAGPPAHLANARHQSGDFAAVWERFVEAERLQAEIHPGLPILSSTGGYRYSTFSWGSDELRRFSAVRRGPSGCLRRAGELDELPSRDTCLSCQFPLPQRLVQGPARPR